MRKFLKLFLFPILILRNIKKFNRFKSILLLVVVAIVVIVNKQSSSKQLVLVEVKKQPFVPSKISIQPSELVKLQPTKKTKFQNTSLQLVPIKKKEKKKLEPDGKCSRIPSTLIGNITVDVTIKPTFEEIENVAGPDLKLGGCYEPSCKATQKVAILIPFKDRDSHLKTLLYHLHPMLMRQNSHYCVFVAEQFDFGQFNKAMIMNAGFKEALKLDSFDCVIFHDVDMIPENDKNLYKCGKQPRHLSPAIDKFQYTPNYGTKFGGVTAITPKQYQKANGHSNKFWGWGGEDNDMEYRIERNNMTIVPSKMDVGRYKMIPHRISWQFKKSGERFDLNKTREKRAETDGLIDLNYTVTGKEYYPTYTKIVIDIRRINIKKISLIIDGVNEMDFEINPGECRWELYSQKYLDFNIPVVYETVKGISKLKPGETLEIPPPPIEKKTKIKQEPKSKTVHPKKPFTAYINSFEDAKMICNALSPECRGIMQEKNSKRFLFRQSGVPRNLVIGSPVHDGSNTIQYFFPSKNCFLKFCPGVLGYIHKYNKTLPVTVENNKPDNFHSYKFKVDFSILKDPGSKLVYEGSPVFEAQLHFPMNKGTMTGSLSHNQQFRKKIKHIVYTFTTNEFKLPNMPGSYVMESKIKNIIGFPLYEWNWWFEVSTNDKTEDAKIRDAFWEEKKEEQLKKEEEIRKQQNQAPVRGLSNKDKNKPLEKEEKLSQLVLQHDRDDLARKTKREPIAFGSLKLPQNIISDHHEHFAKSK